MFSAVGVIPARYGSSRLPGKPLADLQGKPLLYHVFRRASQAISLREVWIATDDERVRDAARDFGAPVVLTKRSHRSGTDRIAEVVEKIEADVVVNIQGDEPLIDFAAIDHAVRLLQQDPDADMATLRTPIQEPNDLWNPSVVKVVADQRGYAVYFSRSPVPYPRVKESPFSDLRALISARPDLLRHFFRHVGLYAYRRGFLLQFTSWAPTPLELLEDLEQLRAIEHGAKIRVDLTHESVFGVDTPEDLERIRKLVKNNPEMLNV
jgi:3-deoxy-manno-octulosonate cytidylyltransferase (CMP-KDO synthetase)